MSESPRKKKSKIALVNDLKRSHDTDTESPKKVKKEEHSSRDSPEKVITALRRKNFITSCEQVSYNSYYNHKTRFQLLNIPNCLGENSCKHHDHKNGLPVSATPGYVEESFKIEMNTNMWCEALEVCQISITHRQYLSANILKDIVEIMLNVHNDDYADYTTIEIINKCQEILSHNFYMHPPCIVKGLRECYREFLTTPMDLKDKSFTNRTEFGCDKGIVKYCMNRLDYELSSNSSDEPLIDKCENIPEEMKQSVKGVYWQKEKFEIYELLNRKDRIDRIMLVLESVIELLKLDLAIWHTRHTTNQGRHIMRSHRPLMAYVLWSDNVLYTGAVNYNCRQIFKLFVQFVSLGYPEKYIKIMKTWLNTIIQTFYICETNSNSDYPNTGKYCLTFAKEFYKFLEVLPSITLFKVLQAVHPNYMRHLIGVVHLKSITTTKEDDVLNIFIEFLRNETWKSFPESNEAINNDILNKNKFRRVKRLQKFLSKKCDPKNTDISPLVYPKDLILEEKPKLTQVHLISILYITLMAYLNSLKVQEVLETWQNLNDQLEQQSLATITPNDNYSYTVSEDFIKKYKSIYQIIKEIKSVFDKNKKEKTFTSNLKVFESISLLDLNS